MRKLDKPDHQSKHKWLPIASAPKDGTEFIAAYGIKVEPDFGYVAFWDKNSWVQKPSDAFKIDLDIYTRLVVEPRHWQPLTALTLSLIHVAGYEK